MSNEAVLRGQAAEALRLGKLPCEQPDRLWGGRGIGAVCAICRRPVTRDQIEVAIEFARNGSVPGLDTYHLHLRCFAAWEFERGPLAASDQFNRFMDGLPRGGYCLDCLSQMYSEPAVAIRGYLGEIGVSGRQATCANCGERRETFRADPSA
jgi:hypothetical protein